MISIPSKDAWLLPLLRYFFLVTCSSTQELFERGTAAGSTTGGITEAIAGELLVELAALVEAETLRAEGGASLG